MLDLEEGCNWCWTVQRALPAELLFTDHALSINSRAGVYLCSHALSNSHSNREQNKMSIAAVQLRHAFGLKGDVTNNVAYLDEQTIFFPTGATCVLYNIDQKSQKFVTCAANSLGMTAMVSTV